MGKLGGGGGAFQDKFGISSSLSVSSSESSPKQHRASEGFKVHLQKLNKNLGSVCT